MLGLKFTSRKFLLTLGAVLTTIGAAVGQAESWQNALWQAVGAIAIYIAGEAHVDAARLSASGLLADDPLPAAIGFQTAPPSAEEEEPVAKRKKKTGGGGGC